MLCKLYTLRWLHSKFCCPQNSSTFYAHISKRWKPKSLVHRLPIQVPINIHKRWGVTHTRVSYLYSQVHSKDEMQVQFQNYLQICWHDIQLPRQIATLSFHWNLYWKEQGSEVWRTTLFSTCVDLHQNSKRLSSQPTHSTIQVICNLQSPTEWIFRTSYIQREVEHLQRRN